MVSLYGESTGLSSWVYESIPQMDPESILGWMSREGSWDQWLGSMGYKPTYTWDILEL